MWKRPKNKFIMNHFPLPPVTLIASLMLSWLIMQFFPLGELPIDSWWGIALIGAGLVLFMWAIPLFKKHATTIEPRGTPSALIAEGPYKFSRNPIYVGYILIALGIVVLVNDWVMLIAPLVFLSVVNWVVIPYEEEMLDAELGDAYRSYRARVRRWL